MLVEIPGIVDSNGNPIVIDTSFIQEYLKRPANDPVRRAAELWQEQQEAKVRRTQRGAAPKTTKATDAKAEGVKKSQEVVAAGRAKAKAETIAEQRKANEKARAAGAALPYPNVGPAPTGGQGGIPGAGRGSGATPKPSPTGLQGPGLEGRDVIPTGQTLPTGQRTTPQTPLTPQTPQTPRTNISSASKTTTEASSKKGLFQDEGSAAKLEKIGINRAVVQYMKENYPNDWAEIAPLIRNDIADKNLTQAEINRIAVAFKNTSYYRNARVEKNRTKIGAYLIDNGLDSVSNKALIDRLVDEVYVKGVNTLEQAQNEIRRIAVDQLGLNAPDADENKRRVATAMLDGGRTFTQAAAAYINLYATTLGLPATEFNPLEDKAFLDNFKKAKTLDEFGRLVKSDPRYVMSFTGRQEINATKLQLQKLTRALGLGYNPQQLEQQAINVAAGKETFEQIEYSLRNIAGEAFPAFKDRILAGETIASIASPYVSSMSRILEIPDSAIDVSDPNNEIRKALIGNGTNPKPLWQFEQELFKDARWQFTSNARDTVDRVSMDILQRFGVMG